MMKRKIGWIAAIAVVLAVSFTLGITGAVSLAGPDGATHTKRITFRTDLRGETNRIITLSDVSYHADEAGEYTATVSGELLRQDENGSSVIDVPGQKVEFRQLNGETWYCFLTVGDEEEILHAYRPRISSIGGETAYGDITYLSYGQVEYLRYDEEKNEDETAPDRFVGMLITLKPLWDCIGDGALTEDDGAVVYAELKTTGFYEDGEYYEDMEYVFPGVEGIRLMMCVIDHVEGTDVYSSMEDEPLTDVHTEMTFGSETKEVLEGTLYLMPGTDEILYFNPVYQKADGRVYVTEGNGTSTGYMSHGHCTLSENSERKINGEIVESFVCEITLNYSVFRIPESCVIYEMSAENACLASHVLGGNECPETMELRDETEYVIIEKNIKNEDGTSEVTREIVDRDAGGFSLVIPVDEILCRKAKVEFN